MPAIPVDTDPASEGAGTETGAAVTVGPFNSFANSLGVSSTRGKTVYVAIGGTAYSTVALQGSFDGSTWVTAKDTALASITIATSGVSHSVLGASYPYIKVVTTGGDGTSTVTCKILD